MEENTENSKVKLCQKMLVLKIQHTPPDSHLSVMRKEVRTGGKKAEPKKTQKPKQTSQMM